MITNVNTVDITLDIASENQGMVEVYVPFLNLNHTETLNIGHTTYNISKSLVKPGNFIGKRGIQVKTTSPVAIYVTSFHTATTGTYLALPTNSLGQLYMASSYPIKGDYSEIAIVSVFPNTTISINNQISVTLDILYNYQMVSTSDQTATVVSSTKPVSVIAGSSCSFIPLSSRECDMIVEQMIPVSMWTNTYIIPPLPPKSGYLARVQTINSTYICLKNKTDNKCQYISMQNSYEEFRFGTEPTVVYTNNITTFSVTQYGMGHELGGLMGDPFMTSIPGLDNFLGKYNFVVPRVYSNFNNYLTVIIKKSGVFGLRLDGGTFQTVYNYTVSRPLDQYLVLITNVNTGYHVLNHINESITFGALLYGLKELAGYGTPLGLNSKEGKEFTIL